MKYLQAYTGHFFTDLYLYWCYYLSDRSRFADLINAEVYHGRQVIRPDGLTEISPVTYRKRSAGETDKLPVRKENREDIVMQYEDGRIYRLFLLEAQDKIPSFLYERTIRLTA